MFNVNKVIIVGRVGKDPEVRYLKNGKCVCSFSVATSEQWKDKESGAKKEITTWFNVVTFQDGIAKYLGENLKKGNLVYVEGKISLESYEGRDGKTHTNLKVNANNIINLSGKERSVEEIRAGLQNVVGPVIDYSKHDDAIPF